ncbi:MAG: Arylmalonate decarboxylase [Alphaproteobacteria bacterium MarineAlpha5_Bin8]|nr:MAG: Arylmalonate decarboxylase [Alphaproteobacteria bacterium MarineAlpha5_Bin7]PPR47168.1 MAG: Arylmalonate decarboxylase [Alphaproteobacteria bacterium MarineAlpha5_Bin8]PPR54190.1 MAG: Arylmalonate decarboxylase [Alphaproteobacteria bacterium MarineAlpha5_Bin6]|tara:strand:- start:1802 stop:2551 length:750 start_codon:yes stop_codon:yes gene_type:complete
MNNFIQKDLSPTFNEIVNPRIGVITLSTDFTIEQDFRKVCHGIDLDIFFNRIPFNNPLNHENYLKMAEHIPEITEQILPKQKVDVIAYGCTSGTIAIGEEFITSQIHKKKPGALVTTPITAALKAFKKLNLKKIAVLTPYPTNVNLTVFNYLEQNNLEVDSFNSFNLNYDSEIAKVSPASLLDGIDKINLENVDGLFVSCTALKILEILEKVEQKFNTTVISSNQAIIWDCLRLSNINNKINGYGKLFQ